MSPDTLLTEWARLLLGSLRAAGVRDVVLSPGSRNTPFTWAALRDPGLRCRSIIDERDAAFFAVGHARITGRPVLLVCTSGSAAANYWPAVVEAAESATPLLVLTADRPLELQHAAAPQTIDQVRLYGAFARAFFDLGTPDPAVLPALPRIAAQAVLATRSPAPGPVHLNARARKPLEPREGTGEAALRLRERVDALLARTVEAYPAEPGPDPDALRALDRACRDARRGLIVCGPEAPWRAPSAAALGALARVTGFPLVAEAASQRRFGHPGDVPPLDAFEALIAVPGFRERHVPDLVLQVGRPPTASAWNAALDGWRDTRRWVLAPGGWPDPWSSAAGVVHGAPEATVRALVDALGEDVTGPAGGAGAAGERTAWREAHARASALARETVEKALREGFSEGAAVRAVADRLPPGGVLALGNSLPVREADLFVPAFDRELVVWSQRGANGIDGLVAGAAGAAAAAGRPTALVLGDVSFAHDVGGLAAARDAEVPLALVVLDNGGGRIFERLPIAGALAGDPAWDAWLTPPRLDIAAAAQAYGIPHARAADREALDAALDAALARPGATVVEVAVPPPGPVAHERELIRRIEARLVS